MPVFNTKRAEQRRKQNMNSFLSWEHLVPERKDFTNLAFNVNGFKGVSNHVDAIGFHHHGLEFVGSRKVYVHDPLRVWSQEDITDATATKVSHEIKEEFLLILNQEAMHDLSRTVEIAEDAEAKLEKYYQMMTSREQDEQQRKDNPSLEKAWQQYQAIKKLCK